METKICSKCGEKLAIRRFNKHKGRKDGLQTECKSCDKVRRDKHTNYIRVENDVIIVEEGMKICSKCKEKLPVNSFRKNICCKDNLAPQCKMCTKIYKKQYFIKNKEKITKLGLEYCEKNKVKIALYHKRYRSENLKKLTEYKKINYSNNKEHILNQGKKYRMQNIEMCVKRSTNFYHKNKESIMKKQKVYYENHKEKFNMYSAKRRNLKKNSLVSLTVEEWNLIKEKFDNKCCYCGKEKPLAKEHFVALSKGGEFTINNIVPSCKSCNSSKGAKLFIEWYPKYYHYSKKREKFILDFLSYNKDFNQQLKII